MAFLPLSAICPALQGEYLSSIQARINNGGCPPGLRKQYELQLEHIRAQAPSHEIHLFPCMSALLGERDSFELISTLSSLRPHQQSPNLRGNMCLSFPFQIRRSLAVLLCVFRDSTAPRYERTLNLTCSTSSLVTLSSTR